VAPAALVFRVVVVVVPPLQQERKLVALAGQV
jgi:hypothetical protein